MSTNFPFTGGKPALPGPGQPGPMNPGEFRGAALPNVSTFGWKLQQVPSAIYIQRDDVLVVSGMTLLATETFRYNVRILKAPTPLGGQPDSPPQVSEDALESTSSTIETISDNLIVPAPGVATQKLVVLAEGYLLSVGVTALSAQFRGQSFVRVTLLRGGQQLSFASYVLLEDYVTNPQVAGWPGGNQHNPCEGQGWRHSIQQANPPAGTDFSFSPVTATRRSVTSFFAQFVASATVATRQISIVVDDGANILFSYDLSATVTAGQTITVSGSQNQISVGTVATQLYFPIPPGLILMSGWRIRAITTNIQAGDQWSLLWFNVEDVMDQI